MVYNGKDMDKMWEMGFQQGKLEEKKEELEFLKDELNQDSAYVIKEDIKKRVKQLQKEMEEKP